MSIIPAMVTDLYGAQVTNGKILFAALLVVAGLVAIGRRWL